MRILISALATTMLIAVAAPAVAASTEADYKAAYAAAESANNEAGKLRNQWTTTVSALAEARKAAETGDFDKAVAASKRAEELAKASIHQSLEQQEGWKQMEIR